MSDLTTRTAKLLAKHLCVEIDRMTPAARFVQDLEADSLDCVEIVMALEEEFEIEIGDDEGDELYQGTFGDAVALVERKLAARASVDA